MLFEVYFVINVETGNKEHIATLHTFKYPDFYNKVYMEAGIFDLLFYGKTAGENFQKKLYILTTLIGGFGTYYPVLDPDNTIGLPNLKDTYLDALHVLSSMIYVSWLYPNARIMHIYPERDENESN